MKDLLEADAGAPPLPRVRLKLCGSPRLPVVLLSVELLAACACLVSCPMATCKSQICDTRVIFSTNVQQ